MTDTLKLVHLSDVHVWKYPGNPVELLNKRFLGVMDLVRGRASRFRLERLDDVVQRVLAVRPDHVLITGDLTTTALTSEFLAALDGLGPLLVDHERVTMLPGNHDRYTRSSLRNRRFEHHFGAFMPELTFPWLRTLDADTAILGLDASRSHISARGYLPPAQMERASGLLRSGPARFRRLIVACHYPVAAPALYIRELSIKRLKNTAAATRWLAGVGNHLYCCGHVHAAWAFRPPALPQQICLNAGAPLYRDPRGLRAPGFLEIRLSGSGVEVDHHAWTKEGWAIVPFYMAPGFFPTNATSPP